MSQPSEINIITVSVNNRKIDINDGYINPVSGNVSHDYLRITLDEEWDALDKRITFDGSRQKKTLAWDGESDVEIPWETLTRPGILKFTVVGSENGVDRLITELGTNQNGIRVIARGAAEFIEPDAPTLDIYTQLVNAAERAEDISDDLEERVESGYFQGEPGPAGESGVYYGETEPEDENVNVWIDPNGVSDEALPKVDESYNGKILRVENGKWTVVEPEAISEADKQEIIDEILKIIGGGDIPTVDDTPSVDTNGVVIFKDTPTIDFGVVSFKNAPEIVDGCVIFE